MSGEANGRSFSVWIVHRESSRRTALARLSAAAENTLLGAPGDALFESAPRPDVVVLGVADDFERELEFAHRARARAPGAAWILVARPEDRAEVERLFEDLPDRLLPDPPAAADLQHAIRERLENRSAQTLSGRRRRDRLSERFARSFGDSEVPGLLRALDPRLERLPLLVRGEPGSGRALVARYVHAFGTSAARPFVHVDCGDVSRESELVAQLQDVPRDATLFFEDVDRLPLRLQRRVREWIEFGLPDEVAHKQPLRFAASAREESGSFDHGLEPELAQVLSVLSIRTLPLRDQPERIAHFARETAHAWNRTPGKAARSFSDAALAVLTEHVWPGNLRELEAVVVRTLASTSTDPLQPTHLRFNVAGEWGTVEPPAPREVVREAPVARPAADVDASAEQPDERAEAGEPDETFPVQGAETTQPEAGPTEPPKHVDVAHLLDELLDQLREGIQSRRLLVLKELDRERPFVSGPVETIERALSGLLGHALASVPDRGDLYLASSHHAAGLAGRPSVRVLLRYRKPDVDDHPFALKPRRPVDVSDADALFAETEALVRELGGAFTGDSGDPREAVIVVDFPAPEGG